MRLTTEQRLQALEREIVILHDTLKMLHKLLKDQGELINDFITQKVASANPDSRTAGEHVRPEDELYTFVCRKRFDRIEKDIKKLLKSIEGLSFGRKAG